MRRRKLTKRAKLKITLASFICIFVCALGYLGYVLYDYIMQQQIEKSIGDLFDAGLEERRKQTIQSPPPIIDDTPDPQDIIPQESAWSIERRQLLEEEVRGRQIFSDILEINEDFLGMIEIPGLVTRQPFVHSRDNVDYLNKDFNGRRNQNGTIFLNTFNDHLFMDNNTVIFGHHTSTGTMFARLNRYKTADTFQSSPVIILDGLIGESTWIVFAANVTEPTVWFMNPIDDYDDYAQHLEEIKARSIFITDVDVTPDDRILTLSVCDYTYEDMRFLVHARKLRPGEEIPGEVIAEPNLDRKDYSVPHQQPVKEVDLKNAVVAINPVTHKLFIYQARAGGIDRYTGDTNQIQGPFRMLTHYGIKENNHVAALLMNIREEEENEDARAVYVAVQGVGGEPGITLFSSPFSRGILNEVELITPPGVDALYPAIQNNHGLWLLYSVVSDDLYSTHIYRQPLLGGEREWLTTVRWVDNARPLGFYYVNDQSVIIWHEPSSGAINGARIGTREVFSVGSVRSNSHVTAYGALSGTSVRIAIENRGQMTFTSIDLSTTPSEEYVEPPPPPDFYIPDSWFTRP